MQRGKRLVALLVVLLTTVGCDQATKSMAQSHLSGEEPRSFLNGLFWLHYAENPGAFLSFGAGLPDHWQHWIFTVAVAVVLIALLLFTLRESVRVSTTIVVALALFLGGGIGNLIDRLTNDGRVIDFMHIDFSSVGLANLRTGVFNVADMALMTGVFLIVLYNFRTRADNGAMGVNDPT
jgi:signal peptidase II